MRSRSPLPRSFLARVARWIGLTGFLAGLAGACGPRIINTQLEEVVLCRDVSRTGEGIPVEASLRFAPRDNRAVLWVRFADLKDPHTIRFRWYDPWDDLYLDTGPVPLNEEGTFHRRATVSSPLPIAGAAPSMLAGKWRVEADYDGTRIVEESFEISGDR